MAKTKKIKLPKRKHAAPGTTPGTLNIPGDALPTRTTVFSYSADRFEEKEIHSIDELKQHLSQRQNLTHWMDVKGVKDKTYLENLAEHFGIHKLQLEDVVNSYQRPKAEESNEFLFLISRSIRENEFVISNDQTSLFVGKNFVLTIQENYQDLLDPVRERIRSGKGQLRKSDAGYLAYALNDTLVDNFFPVLEHISDKLDDLEDILLDNPNRDSVNKLLQIKRDLILLRRSIWAERDKVNDILRSQFDQISEPTKIFFRDTYDHCIQILDLVESYKEVTASLMDVYMSSVSNKMNQVMKVLTIISTIFIPLTFIVGLYGMNFSYINPDTGAKMPLNMPELYSPYGYVTVCALMVIIVILQIIFFVKKGWLTKN